MLTVAACAAALCAGGPSRRKLACALALLGLALPYLLIGPHPLYTAVSALPVTSRGMWPSTFSGWLRRSGDVTDVATDAAEASSTDVPSKICDTVAAAVDAHP